MKLVIFGLALTGLTLAAAPQKTIFAHYMGCYPAGGGALDWHMRQMEKVRHDSKTYKDAIGGRIVNWPLVPQHTVLTAEQSAELEVKRAVRAGLDGFAVDAWAGQESARKTLSALIRAAEKLDAPFFVTVCLDPACHRKTKEATSHLEAYTDTIKWLLENHGNSPKLARRNGKVLIFGYGSRGVFYDSNFYKSSFGSDKWEKISGLYREVEKRVGQAIFWHFCYDTMAWSDRARHFRVAQGDWAGKNFDAVGGFLGNKWDDDSEFVATVKKGGAEWSQPMYFQYNNKEGSLFVGKGFDKLFRCWELAKKYNSTLIQFVTWNDYGEETTLAPGYCTNSTVMNLNRYLIDRWKQDRDPDVTKDVIHLSFRRMTNDAPIFPFRQRRRADGVLEVISILSAPGHVEIPGFGSYEAPKGLFRKQFELKPGKVSARLIRNQKTVLDFTAPEEITDKPWREDNTMVCFSSNFSEEWKRDFGDKKPLLYSENGDLDGDGLPNWFEMYYSGHFPFLEHATQLRPKEDPDLDGLDNLTEYRNQSNPLKETKPYPLGYVWNFDDIFRTRISFNPDRDSNEANVWSYRYRHGEKGAIPRDGKFPMITSVWQNVPYAGLMAHLSPSVDPKGRSYQRLHGWIACKEIEDEKLVFRIRPRGNASQVLCWTSPVNARVAASLDLISLTGRSPLRITLMRNDQIVAEHSFAPEKSAPFTAATDVAVNERLYLVFEDEKGTDSIHALVDHLQIKLEKVSQ
jgi:hypothetical protein